MNPPLILNADAKLLAAALFYAKRQGWAVFPVHIPLHNLAGECVGCTCEHYKRSTGYRDHLVSHGRGHQFDPHYTCPQPGKCPALRWKERSTTDEAQIRQWWGHPWRAIAGETNEPLLFFPNIGIDCGKSDLLTLDADAYKESYAGADLLNWADRQTVTALTGGGGEHLVYARQGLPYGNDTHGLPAGLDIRGAGGYIVAAPSLHKSGRRYQWEAGYGPHETALKPLPPALLAILQSAHQQKVARTATAITFGTGVAELPDLARWTLSETSLAMIHTPAARGQRSEHDAHVVTALCAAGAGDDEILAVFQHFPIGFDGKFGERGLDYLARTITSCRGWLAAQAAERRRTLDTIDTLQWWGQTHSKAPFIPAELRGAHYRTDSVDTKVFDAVCDGFRQSGQLRTQLGKKRLAAAAGLGSCNTALKSLKRMSTIFCVTPDKHGLVIELREEFRRAQIDPLLSPSPCEQGINLRATGEYSLRKASDPFLNGTSRTVKKRASERQISEHYHAVMAATCIEELPELRTLPEILAETPKGLGESCLRVLDALGRCGEMTRAELSKETGKPVASIGRACVRLEGHDLIESERDGPRAAKVYSLAPDLWRRVDELAPTLRTHGLGAEREAKRLQEAQQWAVQEQLAAITAGDQATHDKLERRLNRLGNQRLKVLGHIYPEMAPAALATLAFDVQMPQAPHPALLAKLRKLHANARIEVAEQRWCEGQKLTAEAQRLRTEGLDKRTAVRQLEYAGYTATEAWAAAHWVWPKAGTT